MKWLLKKITALLSAYYAHMMEYRAEIFLWALSGSLPIILMGVWIQAANNSDFGLSSTDFARYFFSVFLVRQFTTIWVIWEFEREVVEGKLSFKLLQPIDPVWHHVARHLAEKITRIPFIIIFCGLFFLLYPDAIWLPSWQDVLLSVSAVIMAFILRFLIQYTFALLAFWTERASAIQQFWQLFYIFLSGLIAPLEVFPDNVRAIIEWTPFPYIIHFPASLLIGVPNDFIGSVMIVLGWSIFLFIVNRWLWKQGLKHYSGMGA